MVARVVDIILPADTHANRPAAATVPIGAVFPCTTDGTLDRNNGTTWDTWATLGGGTPDLADLGDVDLTGQADGDFLSRVGGLWTPVDAPSGGGGLRLVTVPAWWDVGDSVVGAWIPTSGGSAGPYYQSSGAQNDEAVWSLPLGPGTYDFKLAFYSGNNRGIATVTVDDGAGSYSAFTTVDCYAVAPGTDKAVVATGLTISGAATMRSVKIKMATKNASSSGYFALIAGFRFKQTA